MRRSTLSFGLVAAVALAACATTATLPGPSQAILAGPPGPAVDCPGNTGGEVVDGWMRRYPIFRNPVLTTGGHTLRVPWRSVPYNNSVVMEAPAGPRLVVQLWEWERAPLNFSPNHPELTLDISHCYPTGAVPDLVVQHIPQSGVTDTLLLFPRNPDYKESRRLTVEVPHLGDFILARP